MEFSSETSAEPWEAAFFADCWLWDLGVLLRPLDAKRYSGYTKTCVQGEAGGCGNGEGRAVAGLGSEPSLTLPYERHTPLWTLKTDLQGHRTELPEVPWNWLCSGLRLLLVLPVPTAWVLH